MELLSIFYGPMGATFFIAMTAIILLIWHSKRKQKYWEKRGVPFSKPFPLVGTMVSDMIKRQHEEDVRRSKELGPVYGYYEANRPILSVEDPQLVRLITVKDFQYFVNHRIMSSGNSLVDSMLFNLQGEDWKRVRTIISPTFSTGKIKRTMGIFKECSATLVQNLKNASRKTGEIEIKKMIGAMAMDVIASAAFSTKIDSHKDAENKFARFARKFFDTSFLWRMAFFFLFPGLFRMLRISIFHPKALEFFRTTAVQIIKVRKSLGQRRNDFLQLLLDTEKEISEKDKWEVSEADNELTDNYGSEVAGTKLYINSVTKSLSTEEIVAQCIIFFMAGYESTSTTLSITSYLLALHPDVQERARAVIKESLQETNGEVTYEAIQNMKYLDNVISETLRLYSVATRIERQAEADYELGDTGITIEKGTVVSIPVYAIQRDPDYYPNPDKFDPDRFSPEERAKRDPFVYMPFGAGPRNCIGMRFALLESKICLIYILANFDIKTCSKTDIPLKFHPAVNMLRNHDIYLKLEARTDSPIKS